ncbi:RNA-binding protein [Opitutaceae bacterium EW11]|nr:RNA-binding protein [Opitutaceae bacterium EW11]
MTTKLYVGNLSFHTTDSALRTAFEPFGTLTDVHVAIDQVSGRARGFGFVTFSTPEEAQAAVDGLNGHDLDGRTLTVNEARPKNASKSPRSFGDDRRFS